MNKSLLALKLLKSQYDEIDAAAGYPQDYCPDEALYHAIKELESALGLDPSDVDPTLLVHPDCLK